MQITGYVLSLIILILKEYFDYMKRQRSGTNQAKLEIEEFKKIVDAAVIRLRASYKKENNQVGSVEDQMDHEREASGTTSPRLIITVMDSLMDSLKPTNFDSDVGGKTTKGVSQKFIDSLKEMYPNHQNLEEMYPNGKITNDEREIYFIDDIFDYDLFKGFSSNPDKSLIYIFTIDHPSSSVLIKSEFGIKYFYTRKADYNKERGIL
jgi:hypothetical protein